MILLLSSLWGAPALAGGPTDALALCQARKPYGADRTFAALRLEPSVGLRYDLGRCLEELGLPESAQRYLLAAVAGGPANEFFPYALDRLVATAEQTGDDEPLLSVIDRIPPEAFPPRSSSYLYYLAGRQKYDAGDLPEANRLLERVSARHPLSARANFLQGIIANQRGLLRTSVKRFRDVYQEDTRERDLQWLALADIGRVYYAIGRFDNARAYYRMVPKHADVWPRSRVELAWATFLTRRPNDALGELLSLRSPHYRRRSWQPEALVLEALVYFSLCDKAASVRGLDEFDARYGSAKATIDGVLALPDVDDAPERALEWMMGDNELPVGFWYDILRDRRLASLIGRLDRIAAEDRRVDAQRTWGPELRGELHEVLGGRRAEARHAAGLLVIERLAQRTAEISALQEQAAILRFEPVPHRGIVVYDPIPVDLVLPTPEEHWPFNGEFWADEIGYYRFTESSRCH